MARDHAPQLCPECGEAFVPRRGGGMPQAYCSTKCRHRAQVRRSRATDEQRASRNEYERQRRKANRPENTCNDCGGPAPLKARYCESCAATRARAAKASSRKTNKNAFKTIRMALLNLQAGCCALCGLKIDENDIHTDHDHSISRKPRASSVRGILCRRCNFALGWLEYLISNVGLPSALQYLAEPPAQKLLSADLRSAA